LQQGRGRRGAGRERGGEVHGDDELKASRGMCRCAATLAATLPLPTPPHPRSIPPSSPLFDLLPTFPDQTLACRPPFPPQRIPPATATRQEWCSRRKRPSNASCARAMTSRYRPEPAATPAARHPSWYCIPLDTASGTRVPRPPGGIASNLDAELDLLYSCCCPALAWGLCAHACAGVHVCSRARCLGDQC